MNLTTYTRRLIALGVTLSGIILMSGSNARAEVLTNAFTGSISLDGDISDFFFANGLPRPGVCSTNDGTTVIPGVPGSEGLGGGANEPNNQNLQQNTAVKHPSGFNQRRIMAAFNPNVNGGTIFVGLDLPGGTGSAANPNFVDSFTPFVRGGVILPFDADGNGEANTVGRKADLSDLARCINFVPGDSLDIIDCAAAPAGGFSDVASDGEESYAVTIIFGSNPLSLTAPRVTVRYVQDATSFSPVVGQARMEITPLNAASPFGASVSTSTLGNGNGNPLGVDAEFMITNVNAAVTNDCVRFTQTIRAISGSNVDAGNGEDQATLTCYYDLPPGLVVLKNCPSTNVAPGSLLIFTGSVSNSGPVTLTNIVVVNDQPTAGTFVTNFASLAPGQVRSFSGSYTASVANPCGPYIDTLTATARSVCGTNVVALGSNACPSTTFGRLQLTKTCPATNVAPGSLLIFTGTVTNTGNVTLTNVVIVNNMPSNNTPVTTFAAIPPGQGFAFSGSYTTRLDSCGPFADTLTARANSVCDGSQITTNASASCPGTSTPGLIVTKVCPATPVSPGQQLTFGGSVSNSGNVTLTNVTVVNNQPAPGTPVIIIASLAPGQVTNFTGSYTAPNLCSVTDILTVTAGSICGTRVTNTAMATCALTTTTVAVGPMDKFACAGSTAMLCTTPAGNGPFTFQWFRGVPMVPLPGETNSCLTLTNVTGASTGLYCVKVTGLCNSVTNCARLDLLAQLGDFVWLDLNTNGIQNMGEPGVSNVVVNLISCTNTTPIATTNTDANGRYIFDCLLPGSYRVQFIRPAGYSFTLQNAGADDAVDSDADTTTGITQCVTLVPGETNRTVDAGLVTNAVCSPCLDIIKLCPDFACPPRAGDKYNYTLIVTNCGTAPLTNVAVMRGMNTFLTGAFNLPVGGSTNLTVMVTVAQNPNQTKDEIIVCYTPDCPPGPNVELHATNSMVCSFNVGTPCLDIIKNCPNFPAPLNPGQQFNYTLTVTNCGKVPLTRVAVMRGANFLTGEFNLAAGGFTNLTVTVTVAQNPAHTWDEIIVCYTPNCPGINANELHATNSIVCGINMCAEGSPKLVVTKTCDNQVQVPGSVYYVGVVSNAGNVRLMNINVVNDKPNPNTHVFGPVNLDPGQWMNFSQNYPVPGGGLTTDTLTATGVSACGSNVMATGSATCPSVALPPSPIVLESYKTMEGNDCEVKIKGPAGCSYDIEGSDDFETWKVVARVLNTGGMLRFTDPGRAINPSCYYRARLVDDAGATTEVTMIGSANPQGLPTTVYFEWGATASYGCQTAPQSIGAGGIDVTFANTISGFPVGPVYHYRWVAVNSGGTRFGPDTLVNTASLNSGTALSLDGQDDRVDVPDSASLRITGPITLEAWIFRAASGVQHSIVEKYGCVGTAPAVGGYTLRVNADDKLVFRTEDDCNIGSAVIGATSLQPNTWHHVAGVWDGAQLKVYVNGVLDGAVDSTRNPKAGNTPLRIGARGNDLATPFAGVIDEVRVWNAARSAEELNVSLAGNEAGLAGYWRFNEGAGATASDSSPNGNHGTLINGPAWVPSTAPAPGANPNPPPPPPAAGSSLQLDGNDDAVVVPDSADLRVTGPITVEAWVKRSAVGVQHSVVEKYGCSGVGGYVLRITAADKLAFGTRDDCNNGSTVTGGTSLSANTWHHVAGIWDGGQLLVYVNGVLDGTLATTRNPKAGNSALKIGARGNDSGTTFGGQIDEVRLWSTARTAAQIAAGKGQGLTGTEAGLAACWRMDEGAGTTAADGTGKGNGGTLVNGAAWAASSAPVAPAP